MRTPFPVRAGLRLLPLAAACASVAWASDEPAQPSVPFENAKVRILEWTLQHGQEADTGQGGLDRVDVVIQGTGREETGGSTFDVGPGWASYQPVVRGESRIIDSGSAPMQVVSVEIKADISGKTVPPGLKEGEVPPNKARLVSARVVPA